MFYIIGGYNNNTLVYLGTTKQTPNRRINWLKSNGSKLDFTVISTHNTEDDMLTCYTNLTKQYNIKPHKNVKITNDIKMNRLGNKAWCQCCFKRKVNIGYTYCYFCSKKPLLIKFSML